VDELATTHSKDYVQRFLTGNQTAQEQRNVGFPWSRQGVDRALSSVGGTLVAACDACDEWKTMKEQSAAVQVQNLQPPQQPQQQQSPIAPWAAHVAGGTHHAFWDRGEGFSVFSDIAVAANVVLHRYPDLVQKNLIIDLDVHQGNGNTVLFQGRPDVLTFRCTAARIIFWKNNTRI
jgi:acetoin utilization deacetylase AcuC-like enzyme